MKKTLLIGIMLLGLNAFAANGGSDVGNPYPWPWNPGAEYASSIHFYKAILDNKEVTRVLETAGPIVSISKSGGYYVVETAKCILTAIVNYEGPAIPLVPTVQIIKTDCSN